MPSTCPQRTLIQTKPTFYKDVNTPLKDLKANKLANIRRYIMKNKKLTDTELMEIQNKCRAQTAQSAECTKTNQEFTEERNNQHNCDADDLDEPSSADDAPAAPKRTTNETPQDLEESKEVKTMKERILQKWEIIKEQPMHERPPIVKIRKNRCSLKSLKLANGAVREVKEATSLALWTLPKSTNCSLQQQPPSPNISTLSP